MATYYVLDLEIYGPSEWEFGKVEIDARSESDAASDLAARTDEDCADGRRFDIAVASKADGSDARRYTGYCQISVTYHVRKSEPFKVLPPEDE